MNDPFYNLYYIILNNYNYSNNNLISDMFSKLGDNNPNCLANNIVPNNFEELLAKLKKRKVIFHDQEPICYFAYKKEWQEYIIFTNILETNHILSNSEVNSKEKTELLTKTGWKDFYWFSNGFLALEWYRYYRYAKNLETYWRPNKYFSSYNRILSDREHRLILSGYLFENFRDKSILSCHRDNNFSYDPQKIQHHSKYANFALSNSNIFLNTKNQDSNNLSYKIDVEDFINSFCHIVTERIYYEDRIHLTEKIFKPIVCCRPFILVSSAGSLQYLKKYGFKTFSKYWNEDYDKIIDHNERLDKILEVINQISKLTHNEMLNLLSDMKDVLLYNRNHFFNEFQNIITSELYNNLNAVLSKNKTTESLLTQIVDNLTPAELEYINEGNFDINKYFMEHNGMFFNESILIETFNNRFNQNAKASFIHPLVKNNKEMVKFFEVCYNNTINF